MSSSRGIGDAVRSAKQFARRALAYALYYSGVLSLLAAYALRNRLVVLTYHRVLPEDADTFSAPGIIVRPETFSRHMRFIARFFRPLQAADLAAALAGDGAQLSRRCLVTFDDGWRDNLTHALPAITEHHVPILLFVATRFIGSADCFWQEKASRAMFTLARANGAAATLREQLGLNTLADRSEETTRLLIQQRIARLKSESPTALADYQKRLWAACQSIGAPCVAAGDDRFLTWENIQEMVASGVVAIGSHAASHRPLTTLTDAQIREELEEAAARIGRGAGRSPELLAYPNGDVNDEVVRAVAAAGAAIAFTTQAGTVRRGDDPLRLKRINVHEGAARTEPELLCKILGLF